MLTTLLLAVGACLGLIVAAAVLHVWRIRALEKATGLRSIPPLPIFGNILQRNKYLGTPERLAATHDEYGDNFLYWLMWLPFVVTRNPRDAETIFRGRLQKKPGRGMYMLIRAFTGETSIFGDTDLARWSKRRKIVAHAFSLSSVRNMLSLATPMCEELVRVIDQHVAQGHEFELDDLMQRFSFDVIAKLGFNARSQAIVKGYEDPLFNAFQLGLGELFRAMKTPLFVFLKRAISRVLKVQFSFDRRVAHLRKQILHFVKLALEEKQHNPGKQSDIPTVFDLLLEQLSTAQSLDEQALLDDVITFLFAGHDTTAHSLAFAFWFLTQYPQEAAKAQEEVDAVLGERRYPRPKDLSRMPYVEAVFKETLRLRGAASLVARETLEELPLSNGGVIPKGETATVSIAGLHRSEKVYKDAAKFIPERWLTPDFDDVAQRPARASSAAYIPFAGGQRDCVGKTLAYAEGKTVLALLLRNYNFDLARPVECKLGIVLQPVTGVWVTAEKRK